MANPQNPYGILSLWARVCWYIPCGLRPAEPTVPAIHRRNELRCILANGINRSVQPVAKKGWHGIMNCFGGLLSSFTTMNEFRTISWGPKVTPLDQMVFAVWVQMKDNQMESTPNFRVI
jgi:hypothetical protein